MKSNLHNVRKRLMRKPTLSAGEDTNDIYSMKPTRKDFHAVWHMHGRLPRKASDHERAQRYRLMQIWKIIRFDEAGVNLPRSVVRNARKRWYVELVRKWGADVAAPFRPHGTLRRRAKS
jgi:hypothetical protein